MITHVSSHVSLLLEASITKPRTTSRDKGEPDRQRDETRGSLVAAWRVFSLNNFC